MKHIPFAQLNAIESPAVESIEGLRNDPISPAGAAYDGIGFQSLAQLIVALAVVVILIRWLVPKYAAKYARRKRSLSNVDIREVASVTLGVSQAHLIEVRGRTLLLGSNAQGLTLLADLTDDSGTFLMPAPPSNAQQVNEFESVLERLKRLGV